MSTALLLIDIQNDYFENGNNPLVGSEIASENARLILEKFRRTNRVVIHVQHIAGRLDASFFLPKTKGVEIHTTVKPIENEKIIIKHYPNSFRDTDLLSYLQSIHIIN